MISGMRLQTWFKPLSRSPYIDAISLGREADSQAIFIHQVALKGGKITTHHVP